jgi:hypothetical protein
MAKYCWLLLLATLLIPSALSVDLTGHWKSTINSSLIPGPDIYMLQTGNSVWSYAENLYTDPALVMVSDGSKLGRCAQCRRDWIWHLRAKNCLRLRIKDLKPNWRIR